MDCEEFDALVQDMLDRRCVTGLAPAAEIHRQVCDECSEYFSVYSKMLDLAKTADSNSRERRNDREASDLRLSEPARVADRFQPHHSKVAGLRPASPAAVEVAYPIAYPIAYAIPRPGRRRWTQPLVALGAVAACCLAVIAGTNSLPLLQPTGPELPRVAGGDPFAQVSGGIEAAPDPLAVATASHPVPEFSAQELRELTKNWDQSVVALDRGWQRMAVGRVRAHQIPGIQPAVYPITGAVEAFRKNMIVRNQNGLAAGLRW